MTGILPRERLFSLLDQALDRPAVWVNGPGGSGKSTMVASYLDARNIPCIWYQVDEGDKDIATLFYYLGLAAKRAAPRLRKPLPLFTLEYQSSIAAFARRYFERLFTILGSPCILVFDDCHEVPADSIFHEVIKSALAEVPQGINILMNSRQSPPAAMARLLSGKQVSFVEWDDLRLTMDETAGIVKLHEKGNDWQPAVCQLHDRVQGWVAGLVLILERGKADEFGHWVEGKMPRQDIFNYFAEEMFNKTGVQAREFLLKTALLPTITPAMALRLSKNADATRILEELHSANFFTEKRNDRDILYRFHPLFREYLLNKAEATFEPDYLVSLKRTAATLLEGAGRIEEAASLYINSEDWERLIALLLRNASTLIAAGRNATIQEWLNALPHSLLERTPYLLYWLGVCKMTSSFAEARASFEKAYPLFDAGHDAAGLYLTWSGIVDTIVFEWADFSRLDTWIEELSRLLLRFPGFPSREIEGKVAGSIFGALMFHMPQHPDIDTWAERILALVRESSDPTHRIIVGNQLALYHLWWTGDHSKLGMVMDLLRPPGGGERLPPLALITWITLKGLQEWASGLSMEAQRTFAEGLSVANQSGVHVWDFMLYFQGIVSYLGEGDYQTGRKYLDELISRIDRSQQLNLAHYCYVAAWQATLAGENERALEYVRTAVAAAEPLGGPFSRTTVLAAQAQVEYVSGRREEALSLIEKSIGMSREIKTPLLLYRNLMVKAHFYFDSDSEELGLATLREALALGSRNRYMNYSWWQKPVVTKLCLKALENGIETEYARLLIMKRNLIPEEPPLHVENWPWPLKLRTLGKFELLKNGEPVAFSGKVQKKPLELLKALVALGGEESREVQLADLLWPDADGDTARNAFKVTLHRLRDLLGIDKALTLCEGRLAVDRRILWADAWAFEQALTDAQLRGEAGKEAEAIHMTKKALGLYRGHFLNEDADRAWALSTRKRLHNKFIINVVALGSFHQRRGDNGQAISCYLQGLEVDDLVEEFYQKLMECYLAEGLRAEAITAYQSCKENLALSLCIAPSAKTTAIYRSALDG